MVIGINRLVMSCIDNLLEKVVFPDDEGPEMRIIRAPPFWLLCRAVI